MEGGKAYMKLERYERGVFATFTKRGSALYEADRRGRERYSEPENDVLYHVCSVSIAWSLNFHDASKLECTEGSTIFSSDNH